jgi:hypothetical protein
MTGRELFIAGARVFGLYILYVGMNYASSLLYLGAQGQGGAQGAFQPVTYAIAAGWHLSFAAFLLLRTESLARIVYGHHELPLDPM